MGHVDQRGPWVRCDLRLWHSIPRSMRLGWTTFRLADQD
jgi:hypothetical protein